MSALLPGNFGQNPYRNLTREKQLRDAYDRGASHLLPTFQQYMSGQASPDFGGKRFESTQGGATSSPLGGVSPGWGSTFKPANVNKLGMPIQDPNAGTKPTAGGITQVGSQGLMDTSGGFHQSSLGAYGMNPYGSQERIGNVGGVMAPPSPNALTANGRSQMGSMDDFYAARTKDPLTGLPLNPMGNDIMQQQAKLQGAFGQGQPIGRDSQGNIIWSGGGNKPNFPMLGALNQYYGGRAANDPYAIQGGASRLRNLQSQQNVIDKLAQQGKSVAQGARQSAFLNAMNSPMLMFPGLWGLGALAEGGKAKKMNPYMVGEAGPEVYVPKHGKPEVIGKHGPEIRTFEKDGEVISNEQIKQMRDGGIIHKSAYSVPPSMPYYAPPPAGETGRMFRNLFSELNPFMSPAPPTEFETGVQPPAIPLPPSPYSMPRLPQIYENESQYWGEDTPDAFNPLVTLPPRTVPKLASTPTQTTGFMGPLNPYLELISAARQAIGANRGVIPLSEPQSTEQSFLTPRGLASVSFGQPKREAMIEGLPASEWFQRAANRQGEDNRFAKREQGYATAKEKAEREKSNLRKAGVS